MEGHVVSARAIVMSPVMLWWIKVLIFIVWGITCSEINYHSVMRVSADHRDLFLYEALLYYNPLLLVALMLWLWGINLWVFAQSTINYARVFDLVRPHLNHTDIWKCAIGITIVVPSSMTAHLYLYSHGEASLAAAQPAITFSDFFLADIMTSMAKVFSDLERSICRMANGQVLISLTWQVATIARFEEDSICGSHSVAIPLLHVFPYMCRLIQCLRQYKDTNKKECLLNALKYYTAGTVIFLSALKYHVFPEHWINFYRPLWFISGVVNSFYSFYWDIKYDWNLSILTNVFKFRSESFWSKLLSGRAWVHYWVIGSNLVLRCTWAYKLSERLRHSYSTVLVIAALEIVRRFQWIFFRVENEWNKISAMQNSEHETSFPNNKKLELPAAALPDEEERPLL